MGGDPVEADGRKVAWGLEILALEAPGWDDRLAGQRATTAALARRWFDQKLGWAKEFAGESASWRGLLSLIEQTQGQSREGGLHSESTDRSRRDLGAIDIRGRRFARQVCELITDPCRGVPRGRRYVRCGEVIESIFGKYKSYLERSPSPSLGANMLLRPLMVTGITPDLVAEALRTVKHRTIRKFTQHLCGSSQPRLRRELRPPPMGANAA